MMRPSTSLLSVLVAPLETGFIELRPIAADGSGASEWFAVEDHVRACERAIELREFWNVYFGVVPRRKHGGRGAGDVGLATAVWADLDSAEAVAASRAFETPPTARVQSGTDENEHAYWFLRHPHEVDEVVQLNRDLAVLLGADVRATDAARILRLPGTYNHKQSPPREVTLIELVDTRIDFAELRAAVPLGAQAAPRRRGSRVEEEA